MADMQPDNASLLAEDLLALTARLGARADEDPFGNPVLLVALAITRRMDTGELTEDAVAGLIRQLRDAAFADRAIRTAAYVGGFGHLLNMGQAGFLEHDETVRGIRLFAREVYPQLQEFGA